MDASQKSQPTQYRLESGALYGKNVKMARGMSVPCYSKEQLSLLHPEGGYEIVGEVAKGAKRHLIGQINLLGKQWNVAAAGSHGASWRCQGYLPLGNSQYLTLLKDRSTAFWLAVLVVALFVSVFTMLFGGVLANSTILSAIPVADANAVQIEGDDSEKMVSEDGGGAVTLTYSLDAALDLDTGDIDMYFANPNSSNQNIVLDLYIVSGGTDILIAESGMVNAGNALYRLNMIDNSAILSQGTYNAKYMVTFYDETTGEKALVQSDVEDVVITAA